jgi:MoaA/NifB/PqqE/SkfB family radical SAM enzyme
MTDFFLDPAINRKSQIVNSTLDIKQGWPPSVVEISESGTCNRKCAFCPRSAEDFPDVKEFIEPALIRKIALELAEFNYSGIFLFSGFVEPMLDKGIYEHVNTIHSILPQAKIEMVTNGDVLDTDRLIRLFDAGLSTILISVYDSPEDADRFSNMCEAANLRSDQYVIRHRYLPENESFGITLNNRAGMMEKAAFVIKKTPQAIHAACHYPHYTFFMDYLGDVLMCPHDWGKRKIMGNLKAQSFKEIWLGQGFLAVRESLAKGSRGFVPCNVCDVKGSLMGKEHVRAWEEIKAR